MTQPSRQMLRASEVAKVLRVSNMTVYRLIDHGDLAAHRVGRSYRIDARDFADYMCDNRTVDGAA